MKLSDNGLNLIKKFEGLRLKAYKCVATEKYYTIGYGHYGSDVKKDMLITEAQASELLMKDCSEAMSYVDALPYCLNQNQYDALVSFTYNCGCGNLKKLTANNTRSLSTIGTSLLLYNKSGGKTLAGLTKRRKEEHDLFLNERKCDNVFRRYS